MDIENLKCFLLVAENLSFVRAAEALYISQPAVTKQINALENELGTSLFIRSTRHVELTPAGMSFYKDAKEIVHKSQLAIEHIQSECLNNEGIRMGVSNPTALNFLAPLLKKLHEKHPDVRPAIEVLSYKAIRTLFLDNKLDILFYYRENFNAKAGIQFSELTKDSLCCLIPSQHFLAAKSKITGKDLLTENIIACNPMNAPLSTADFQQKLLKQYPAQKVMYCNTIEIAHCMVRAEMGITILPSLLCPKDSQLMEIPLEDSPRLSYGYFYHIKNKNNVLRKFIKLT